MYSSTQGLPETLHRNDAPRVSTPLNLTPPDLGEFIRNSNKKAIQAPDEDAGNNRFVTPYKSSSSSDTMARGGSGSVAKAPFLEVLERCGQLEMENQGLQAKCKAAEEKLRHFEKLNYQELEAKCKAAEEKLSQYENMDYQGMEKRCKILQVRLKNVEKELAKCKEERAYVAAEKQALREEKAEMMDRLRKVDKEASNSLRIAQAVEKVVIEHRDLKEISDLHLRELEAARALITEMGLKAMKEPIVKGEKDKSDDKDDLELRGQKKIAKKSKTLSPGSAPGGMLRFGVGSDTVTPPPNRPRASLFGSRDDYGFQGCYNSSKENSDTRDWRRDEMALVKHLEAKNRKKGLGRPSPSILENASFVTAAQSLSPSPTHLELAEVSSTNAAFASAGISPPRKVLNVRERLRNIVEKRKRMTP